MQQRGSQQHEDFGRSALEVYLLPATPWEQVVALQQRLVYEIGGEPDRRAALILCEHPPILTVGRQGSRRHILVDDHDLHANEVVIRWTNRGGGCWLFGAGQLAIYPIVPIDSQALGLDGYRCRLYETLRRVLAEFRIAACYDAPLPGLHVEERELASIGVAVKNWVAYHGACLNVSLAPERFDWIQPNPQVQRRLTSIFRETRTPVRVDAVRESVLRHFIAVFGFGEHYLCNPPPLVPLRRPAAQIAS